MFGGGGAAEVRTFDQSGGRYRVQLFIQGQNLTNQANYLGYSGTLSSPFFGRPTTVRDMRKIDAGINLNFSGLSSTKQHRRTIATKARKHEES